MTDDNFTAPPLATVDAAAREFGISRSTLFRMIHAGQMPRLMTGEKGLRVPMHAARKMLAGESIDPALLADPQQQLDETMMMMKKHQNPSPLRYPGGKQKACKILLPMIPASTTRLFSPFFGGGSVELQWAKNNPTGQVLGCELFEPLATFWHYALKDSAPLLLNVLRARPLEGAISKEALKDLRDRVKSGELQGVDLAAATFIINRCSVSGATFSGGFSDAAITGRFTDSSIDKLAGLDLPNVTVQHADAFDFLTTDPERFTAGTAFTYLDPPYALDDASTLYGTGGSTHRGFDHARLAEVLKRLDARGARWMMSYNNDPAIRGLYDGFEILDASWAYGMNQTKKSSELVVLSSGATVAQPVAA